jgi:hypothetical protein
MLKIKNYFIIITLVMIVYPMTVFAQDILNQKKSHPVIKQNIQKPLDKDEKQSKQQILTVTPRKLI